jgi:hypothetical protein
MYSKRKTVYSNDLLKLTSSFTEKINDISTKLGKDAIIDDGLFVMITSLFEDTVRQIMRVILISFPEKLRIKSCTISKDQVCNVADKGVEIIIDNELYSLFHEGMKEQLDYLFYIISNIKKTDLSDEISCIIAKCCDISLYRNSIVHNGGKPTNELLMNTTAYKIDPKKRDFDRGIYKDFVNDYLYLFSVLDSEIQKHFEIHKENTRVEQLRELWYGCFNSPIMKFEDYWKIDLEKDLISDIKYCEYENSISSSEEVLLSIWRHQFYDAVKTKEFLLCSINYEIISDLYEGLSKTQFYYMYQQSRR